MGGGMDAALTGVDQIEVGEQQLTSREPLNGWEWDTRTNLLARVGGHELVRSKRHTLTRNDIERIRRVVGMLRTKKSAVQQHALHPASERRAAPLSMVLTKFPTTSMRLWDAATIGAFVNPS